MPDRIGFIGLGILGRPMAQNLLKAGFSLVGQHRHQESLPVPEYREGDRVHFVRDACCAREGVVRVVLFQGKWSECREQDEV